MKLIIKMIFKWCVYVWIFILHYTEFYKGPTLSKTVSVYNQLLTHNQIHNVK